MLSHDYSICKIFSQKNIILYEPILQASKLSIKNVLIQLFGLYVLEHLYFSENGILSYANPNYHMDPQHLERNSHLYDEILSELHQQGSLRQSNGRENRNSVVGRKGYAKLDIGQMGVDLKENFRQVDMHFFMR